MKKEVDRDILKLLLCVLRKENIGEVSRSDGMKKEMKKEADREYIKIPPLCSPCGEHRGRG